MTDRYALADLNDCRWDEDAPVEGDREDVTNPAGLLANIRYAFSGFVSVFLFSEQDANTGLVRREPWEKASRWLKSVEDMARGLLLMMALALPAPLKAPPKSSSGVAPAPTPKPDPVPPPEPAPEPPKYPKTSLSVVSWLLAPAGKRSGDKSAATTGAVRWRLANRWHRLRGLVCRTDALLRILNDPAPFAQRVARRLDGLNQPLRFPEYKPPPPPRLLKRNEQLQDIVPGNPYRFILAPLWAHLAGICAARESPG